MEQYVFHAEAQINTYYAIKKKKKHHKFVKIMYGTLFNLTLKKKKKLFIKIFNLFSFQLFNQIKITKLKTTDKTTNISE